jgi:hypothetical protein
MISTHDQFWHLLGLVSHLFVTCADLSLSHYSFHKMFNDTVSDRLSPVSRFGKHVRSATSGESHE